MITFKCIECGKIQKSSCLCKEKCEKCSGDLEVWNVEEEGNEDGKRN